MTKYIRFFLINILCIFSIHSVFAQGIGMDININIEEYSSGNAKPESETAPAKKTITAELKGDQIVLGDGRTLNITYKKNPSFSWPRPIIEMLSPVGAKVVLSYDGRVRYNSEAPFLWKEGENDKYLKFEVEEYDRKWSLKIKPKNDMQMTISGESNEVAPIANDGPWIKLNKTSYGSGEQIEIKYGGFTNDGFDWITVIRANEAEGEWGDWEYIKSSGTIYVDAPDIGNYQVRGYFHSGKTSSAKLNFTVK